MKEDKSLDNLFGKFSNIIGDLFCRIFLDSSRLTVTGQPDGGYTCYTQGQTITLSNGNTITCQTSDVYDANKANFLEKYLLKDALRTLKDIVLVDPVEGNLTLEHDSCYSRGTVQTPIPDEYTTDGTGVPNADLIIFATARKVNNGNVAAFAGTCQRDQ
jgi:hypothetical protein